MRPAGWFTRGLVLAVLLRCSAAGAAGSDSGAISQRFPPDARSRGMGDAFTALAEGPAAVWWNPAALTTGPELAVEPLGYSRLVPDLADDVWIYYFSATGRRNAIGAGANLNYLSYGESQNLSGFGGVSEARESALRLGAGVDLLRLLDPGNDRFHAALGASWNRFDVSIPPTLVLGGSGGTASAWDMDLGALLALRLPVGHRTGSLHPSAVVLRAGSVFGNILDHELDFDGVRPDPVGKTIRSGLAAGFDLGDSPWGYALCIRVAADRTSFDGKASGSLPVNNFGYEFKFLELISLRRGRVEDRSGAIEDWGYGLGLGHEFHNVLGLRTFGFQLDYARIPQAEPLTQPKHFSIAAHCGF
jgi:hypothetical protein